MPDYAYLNARIRAMRSRLLSGDDMSRLAAAPDLQRLLVGLAPTAYGQWLAPCRGDPRQCLADALRQRALATLAHLRHVCTGQERAFAEAAFAGFDGGNIAVVLRGVAAKAPAEQTLEATMPFGPLGTEALAAAAAAPDVVAAVALLPGRAGSAAAAVRLLLQRRRQAGPLEIEATLQRWRLGLVARWSRDRDDQGALREAHRLQADVGNILLALRLSADPGARDFLASRLAPAGLASLFAATSRVNTVELMRAASAESPAAALAAFHDGPYGATLKGVGDLAAAERALRAYKYRRLAAFTTADPLGPGLLVGFLADLERELVLLRRIEFLLARGRSASDALELAA